MVNYNTEILKHIYRGHQDNLRMEAEAVEARLNRDNDKPEGDSVTKTTGDNKAKLEHMLEHLNQHHRHQLRAKAIQAGVMVLLSRMLDQK